MPKRKLIKQAGKLAGKAGKSVAKKLKRKRSITGAGAVAGGGTGAFYVYDSKKKGQKPVARLKRYIRREGRSARRNLKRRRDRLGRFT